MLCTRHVIVHRERGPLSSCFGQRSTWEEDTEIYTSGVRWVAVRLLSRAMLIISAHLPHARQSVLSYRETLQEITCCLDRFKSAFPRHHVLLGANANISLNGFEDGRFVGDATVLLTKARSCADGERAGALYELMLSFGLRADNSWTDWNCVTRVGWQHECKWISCSLPKKHSSKTFGSTPLWFVDRNTSHVIFLLHSAHAECVSVMLSPW